VSERARTSARPDHLDGHIVRPRLQVRLESASRKPVTIVCAGAGFGKTRAVQDFALSDGSSLLWVQISPRDDTVAGFWEHFIQSVAKLEGLSFKDVEDLDVPGAEGEADWCAALRSRNMTALFHQRYLIVFDGLHHIKNPEVIHLIERLVRAAPENSAVVLISREDPRVNFASLCMRDDIDTIQEEDLKFTEDELSCLLEAQGLVPDPLVVRDIAQDTGGWARSVDFVVRSLKNAPGYHGYTRDALRKHVSESMKAEVFDAASDQLRHLLVRLSLIDHPSEDLCRKLAGEDEALLAELWQQNAYVRSDPSTNTLVIHPALRDDLLTRHDILAEDEKRSAYRIAARWYEQHAYLKEALNCYGRSRDYAEIIRILFDVPFCLPADLALLLVDLCREVADEQYLQVDYLAVMYLRAVLSLGREQEFIHLAEDFEQKVSRLPAGDTLREHTLGSIYQLRGIMRFLLSRIDGVYDFDDYFARARECLESAPLCSGVWLDADWITGSGTIRPDASQDSARAMKRMFGFMSPCLPASMAGLDDLGRAEQQFYLGDLSGAEPLAFSACEKARDARQFETVNRALLYALRIAFAQGKEEQAREILKELEALRDEEDYPQRFVSCDIAVGWYYALLRQPDQIPGWLKEEFSAPECALFTEGRGNQVKALAHLQTKRFAPLLAYISEMKGRGTSLYGCAELLALEACARYQMRDRAGAIGALQEAWRKVADSAILMPFVERGKDMRTLSAYAISDPSCTIPGSWLETVNKRSTRYARSQALAIARFERESGQKGPVALSAREAEVLQGLYDGLSRAEIAARQSLSLSTVNMNIQNIYSKLHARNVADVIHIAAERRLISTFEGKGALQSVNAGA